MLSYLPSVFLFRVLHIELATHPLYCQKKCEFYYLKKKKVILSSLSSTWKWVFPKGTFILVVYMSHVQPQRLKPILCNRLLSFFLLDSHKKVHTQFSFLCSSGQGEAGGGRGPFLYCSCWIQSTVHVFAFLIHQLEDKANISIDQGIKTDNKLPPMYHLLGFLLLSSWPSMKVILLRQSSVLFRVCVTTLWIKNYPTCHNTARYWAKITKNRAVWFCFRKYSSLKLLCPNNQEKPTAL